MTYLPGTILARKVPFDPPEDENDTDMTPFNEIKVIGHSPVQSGIRTEEWAGQLGDNISITPTSFGSVVDRPLGELQRDYAVEYEPQPELTVEIPPQPTPLRQPSPEDVFRSQQDETPSGERVATPLS